MNIASRNFTIDYLRAIALLCIILAHSCPDALIGQLRNFDVILMVLLMGMSFELSAGKTNNFNYKNYIFKRFDRLILLTWKFLSLFFIFFFFLSFLSGNFFSMNQIVGSFTIFDGVNSIGYVWIMRVFFLIAILNPLLFKLSNKIKSNIIFILTIVALGLFYYLVILNISLSNRYLRLIYNNIVVYTFGYGIIAYLGIRLNKFKKSEVLVLAFLFLILYLVLGYNNQFAFTQAFKYPPRFYYLAYGLFISLFLFVGLERLNLPQNNVARFLNYLSVNSIYIYFWHIVVIYLINKLSYRDLWMSNFLLMRFFVLLMPSLVLTYVQLGVVSEFGRKLFAKA